MKNNKQIQACFLDPAFVYTGNQFVAYVSEKEENYLHLILHRHLFVFAALASKVAFFEIATANRKQKGCKYNIISQSVHYVFTN